MDVPGDEIGELLEVAARLARRTRDAGRRAASGPPGR
jgi:hypothetical protein